MFLLRQIPQCLTLCYDDCILNHLSRLLSRICREYCSIRHCRRRVPEYFCRIRNSTSAGPLTDSGHKSYGTPDTGPLRVQQTSIWTYIFKMETVICNLFKVNVISIFSLYYQCSLFKHNRHYGHFTDTDHKHSLS